MTAGSGSPSGAGPTSPAPPRARRDTQAVIEQLGRARSDPYAWLKDDNWREVMRDTSRLRADIRTHLEAENAYTQAVLEAPTAALQDQLFEEMRGRIKENDSSVPAIDGPWAYYRRFREGGEYPLFARRAAEHAFDDDPELEQLLIDGDAMAKGCDYFDIRKVSHSPDHRLIAFAVDDKGSEFYTLHIRDCVTGAEVDDDPRHLWRLRLGRGFQIALLGRARRERPPGRRLLPPPRKRRRRAGLSRAGPGLLRRRAEERVPPLHLRRRQRPHDDRVALSAHRQRQPRAHADRRARTRASIIPSSTSTTASGSAPTAMAPSTSRWSPRRTNIPRKRTGGSRFRTVPASCCSISNPSPTSSRAWSARTACRASSCANAPPAPNTPSTLRRPPTRSACPAASSGTRPGCASNTPRPARPRRSSTTTCSSRQRILRKTQEVPSGHNPDDYIVERIDAPGDDGALVPVTLAPPPHHAARRHGARAALRLWLLRHHAARRLPHRPPQPRRSRLHLRHRRRARIDGQGLSVVSRRQAREEGQHLHRLRRRRPPSRQAGLHVARPHRRAWAARPAAC